nr:immunoglobulin light chain junction region [Macaca mulatta]MOV77209.1 immunoglobulin light chain junction region [Macaca mulatta]MOW13725.1 immunoglobulin light chain junction region [Macaca mulatta]
CQQSSSFPFTF